MLRVSCLTMMIRIVIWQNPCGFLFANSAATSSTTAQT